MQEKKVILYQENITIKLNRLSYQIAETTIDTADLVIIGIRENGFRIADKIAALLKPLLTNNIILVGLSLNKSNPDIVTLDATIDFNNKNVLLVDDVCNSGKTLLYALKPLLNSHPKKIEVLVLVDRMYKQFPVKPNFVGLSVATTLSDFIEVIVENDEIKEAVLISK